MLFASFLSVLESYTEGAVIRVRENDTAQPKDIMIGGRAYTARPMRPAEAVHGAVLRARDGRNVYRIVGVDGAEAVLRNVRRPDGFVAWDASRLCEDFLIVEAPSPREGK